MSYSEDWDDYEQAAQGQEVDRAETGLEKMCASFDLSVGEFNRLSGNEKSQIIWHWKNENKRRNK